MSMVTSLFPDFLKPFLLQKHLIISPATLAYSQRNRKYGLLLYVVFMQNALYACTSHHAPKSLSLDQSSFGKKLSPLPLIICYLSTLSIE